MRHTHILFITHYRITIENAGIYMVRGRQEDVKLKLKLHPREDLYTFIVDVNAERIAHYV